MTYRFVGECQTTLLRERECELTGAAKAKNSRNKTKKSHGKVQA